jgi:hypothetical protein
MAMLTETPPQQVPALAMARGHKETPGVKKLAKGYRVLPKETLSRLTEDIVASVFFTILFSCLVGPPALGLARIFNLSVVWAFVVTGSFAIFCLTKLVSPSISWMRNDPESPFVINKQRRANLKKTRSLAAQLGESIVPVLKEDHLTANLNVHQALVIATGVTDSREYDRIAVLLLEDLKREPLLLDIINNRGLTTMDEVEEALRDIESTITGPVQSGWL